MPDHELRAAIDYDNRTLGALRYMSGDGTYFSRRAGEATDEVMYYHMGSDREFPRNSLVRADDVRTAVKEFLTTAERPDSIDWQNESTR